MKILILAGGYGTRLYPIVKDIPKALLEVHGKPLITFALEKFLKVDGVDEVCVVTNDKFAPLISAWADKHNGKPFRIRVVNDGTRTPEERLGAIGDLLYVLDHEGSPSDWVVIGSDNLFDGGIGRFIDLSCAKAPAVTIGCYDIGDIKKAGNYGVIELDASGKILSLEEKPKEPKSALISMCLYFFPKDSLGFIRTFVDETNSRDTTGGYIQWLYKKSDTYGFKFQGEWYDIGSLESYQDAQQNFSG